MAQNPTSGYGSYVNYGFENTYGTASTGTRTFGHGVKITHDRKNTMERLYGLGSRNAAATIAKKFEGTADVEFILSNGSFFRAVLGDVADAGSGPYTHTYTETNVIPSFSILSGTEIGTNDEVTALLGCKVNTMTMTSAVGEAVKVRLNCLYQNETLATSGISSQVAETELPFTFASGTLSLGGTIGNVQSIELTVNNTIEGLWGLGSRLKTAEIEKIREYNFSMSVAFSNVADLLQKFYGNATGPATGTPVSVACVLTFTNGESGTDERSIVLTFANLYIDTEKLPKDVNEIIKEDVTGWTHSCTSIVYTNNTAVDEGNP
jgi:hypothetical protein